MKRKSTSSKRKMKISVKRRLNLIDLVLNQGYSIVRASKKLELKAYTAASIINKFKEKGVVFDLKLKKYIKPSTFQSSQSPKINNSLQEPHSVIPDLQEHLEVEQEREKPHEEMPEAQPSQKMNWMPFWTPHQTWCIFYY